MILDALEIPNLSYEILEGSDRVGGRVYTHHFSETKHDYYDVYIVYALTERFCWLTAVKVGAMRFPRIPIMEK